MTATFSGTVADVMLPSPKTLPGSATVADVRAQLANASVQMVLLADGTRFRGAVTSIPPEATDDEDAVRYADASPESISVDESAQTAFDVTAANPYRRVVVLGSDAELLGLVCLDQTRTRFCGIGKR